VAELADIRRRVRHRIDQAQRTRADRRRQIDAAQAAYDRFLVGMAVPIFQKFAISTKAEGYQFNLLTPERAVRLVSEGHSQDAIELELDVSRTPAGVIGRWQMAHGRDLVTAERLLGDGVPVERLTEEDVLSFLIDAFGQMVER
jgi:hypothetical protein